VQAHPGLRHPEMPVYYS